MQWEPVYEMTNEHPQCKELSILFDKMMFIWGISFVSSCNAPNQLSLQNALLFLSLFFFLPKWCAWLHLMANTQFCKVTAYILQNYCVQIWMYQGSRACFWWANLINLFCFSILAWSNWWWLGGNYRWPDYWIREAAQAEACIQHCILLTCIAPVWDTEAAVDGG